MVSPIVQFACDICRERFSTEEEAAKCEARGKPAPLEVGLVFSLWGDEPMVFAVMSWIDEGHSFRVSGIAARDNGAGDNLRPGEGRCGFDVYAGSDVQHELGYAPDVTIPAFQRMCAALREQGIEPTLQTRRWEK